MADLLQRMSSSPSNKTPKASRRQLESESKTVSPISTNQFLSGKTRKETRRPSQTPRLTNKVEEEDAIFNSMDPRYKIKDFDPIANILQKVSIDFSQTRLESELNSLDVTKAVIDKRLSDAVMKNYGSFVQGMQHIHDVKMDLAMTDVHCTNGRRSLARAEQGLIHTLMRILSRHRKKTRLMKLYSITIAIRRLVDKEKLMETLLDLGEYPAAVITYNECVEKLKGMNSFHCLNEMSLRFEKNRETIRELFDQKLMGLCINYQSNFFQNIIRAYVLLGEGAALGVILRQSFINALEDVAKQAITKHISTAPPTLESLQFSALCRMIETQQFKACFLDVCSSICQLLFSSHSMMSILSNVESFSVLPDIDENIDNEFEHKENSKREGTHEKNEFKAQNKESLAGEGREKKSQEKYAQEKRQKELSKKKRHIAKINDVMRKHHKNFETLPKVGQELKDALSQIWNKCQDKLSSLLKSAKLTTININIEEFLQILNAGYKLIAIGERLTGTTDTGSSNLNSPELAFGRNDIRSSLLEKSSEYVIKFHRETFETLRATFESEMWRSLPVASTFSLKDIKELRGSLNEKDHDLEEEEQEHLWEVVSENGLPIYTLPDHSSEQLGILYPKTKIEGTQDNSWVKHAKGWSLRSNENRIFLRSVTSEEEVANKRKDGFEEVYKLFVSGGNPFLFQTHLPGGEITTNNSNNGEKVELLREKTPIKSQRTLTSTSLSTARRMGRYIHIMRDISPLAVEALKGLHEIFDFYLYSIFNLFGISSAHFYSGSFTRYPRLKEAVISVRDRVLAGSFAGGVFKEFAMSNEKIDPAHSMSLLRSESEKRGLLNMMTSRGRSKSRLADDGGSDTPNIPQLVQIHSIVDLNDPDTLSGTVERCVATESIMLLVEVLKKTKNYISSLLPSTERYRVKELVKHCCSVVDEFQSYIYRNLAPLVLPFEQIHQTLEKAQWDLNELQSKNNSYVDALVTAMKTSDRTIIARDGLPEYVMKKIWSETIEYTTEQLVIGYSKIKKCTNLGRALMTQDLNVLKKEIGLLTGFDPLPSWDYVTNYVEGFYFPEEDFLKWMTEHPNYSMKQYVSIANSGPGASMKRKERQVFIEKVQERFERIQKKIDFGDFSGLSSDNNANSNEPTTTTTMTIETAITTTTTTTATTAVTTTPTATSTATSTGAATTKATN